MTTTETTSKLFEDTFENVKKAAEAGLKMQQEAFRQWSLLWPALPTPQSMWLDQVRDFQKEWSHTVSELAKKHRDVVDKQYQAALTSMDEALHFAEAKNPEEFRKRSEQLFRKTIDCLREISEVQMNEFKEATTRWTELLTKAGS